MIEAVVKIGGRLGRGERLRPLCERVAALGRRHRLLVVPGGGAFADTVRDVDVRYGLGDTAAHWMAVLAMDQYGYLLADLIPGSAAVRSPGRARELAAAGGVPVLLPFDLLRRADPLPHSWAVTSDSIAAWVAGLAGAPRLVLVKDSTGLDTVPGGGDGFERIPLEQLAAWEGVDRYLGSLLAASRLDLWVINGEEPDRLAELLETGWTAGVQLQRSCPSAAAPSGGPRDRAGGRPDRPPCGPR